VTKQVPGTTGLDIGRWQRQELFLGALVPTALGIAGLVAAVAGLTTGSSTAERVVVGVLGGVFLAVGAGLFYWLLSAPPTATLEINDEGIAQKGRKGVAWQLPWTQVTSAVVVRTRSRTTRGLNIRGPWVRVRFPRHGLRLRLTKDAPAPHERTIDLGVPAGPARALLELLGPRSSSPRIERTDDH
jgi:hypothetical protein